jgi:hemoglobin
MKVDITKQKDIVVLVDRFYEKVNADNMLSPIFNDFAKVNWEKHMPIMYKFWGSILLQSETYRGQPFPKHMRLPVNEKHFERWLVLFYQTVNENFQGPKAQEAIQRGLNIANVFMYKMGFISELPQPD